MRDESELPFDCFALQIVGQYSNGSCKTGKKESSAKAERLDQQQFGPSAVLSGPRGAVQFSPRNDLYVTVYHLNLVLAKIGLDSALSRVVLTHNAQLSARSLCLTRRFKQGNLFGRHAVDASEDFESPLGDLN
jgi:hypothetical protein